MNAYAPPALNPTPNLLDSVLNWLRVPTDVTGFEGLTKEQRTKAYEVANATINTTNDSFTASPATLTENGKAAKQIQELKPAKINLLKRYASNGFDTSAIDTTFGSGRVDQVAARGVNVAEKITEYIDKLPKSELQTALVDLNKTDPRKAAQLLTQIAGGGDDILKTLNAMKGHALKKLITAGHFQSSAKATSMNYITGTWNFVGSAWNGFLDKFFPNSNKRMKVLEDKANMHHLMSLARDNTQANPSAAQSIFKFGEEWSKASGLGAKAAVVKDGIMNLFSGGFAGLEAKTGSFGEGAKVVAGSMWDSIKSIAGWIGNVGNGFVKNSLKAISVMPLWGKALSSAGIFALASLGVRFPGMEALADTAINPGTGGNLKDVTNLLDPMNMLKGLFGLTVNAGSFFLIPMIAGGLMATGPVAAAVGGLAMLTKMPGLVTMASSIGLNLGVGGVVNGLTSNFLGNHPSEVRNALHEANGLIAESNKLTGSTGATPTPATNPSNPSMPSIPPDQVAQMAQLAQLATLAKKPKV